MISIICCYNNKLVFEQMLKMSIDIQKVEYELIGINNVTNKFNSAASALNYGASLAKGDYYVFVHQDMEIFGDDFLESVVKYIDELNDCIIGLAGKKDLNGVYTNIRHGDRNQYAGEFRIEEPKEVQTLDECFIAMSKGVFDKLKFDENNCDNWHLYAVDMCLSAKLKNIKSYVVPLEAFHASSGVLSNGYWKTMDKLVAKYKKEYLNIFTTCTSVNTGYFEYLFYKLSLNLKIMINKKLQKYNLK
jgi:glycosyltransferase involved in cell wall biosynthesis